MKKTRKNKNLLVCVQFHWLDLPHNLSSKDAIQALLVQTVCSGLLAFAGVLKSPRPWWLHSCINHQVYFSARGIEVQLFTLFVFIQYVIRLDMKAEFIRIVARLLLSLLIYVFLDLLDNACFLYFTKQLCPAYLDRNEEIFHLGQSRIGGKELSRC